MLLAGVAALYHFQFLLEGRKFHVLTEHKPLVLALHRARDTWSTRQSRHLACVAEFTSDLSHVAGADNVVADCLSRPPEELSLSVCCIVFYNTVIFFYFVSCQKYILYKFLKA